MKKAVLFDLDGTLWDSAVGVCKAWNCVLERKGMEPDLTVEKIHGMMGKQMDVIAAMLFPEHTKEEQTALIDECAEEEHIVLARTGGTLFPNLEEILTQLGEKYTLGIISNCQSGYIETFFAAHGLGKYFADIECFGNNGFSKGENIALLVKRNGFDKAIYVGDTQGDYEGAVYAGLPFIHAAYGFGTAPEAQYSINSICELPALADEILG
ncbi:MAG: HAD family hydrolase [Oscillospiraceae bacterium]|nr:HAD family hydrolase [Oscillospiraceae bacterium]